LFSLGYDGAATGIGKTIGLKSFALAMPTSPRLVTSQEARQLRKRLTSVGNIQQISGVTRIRRRRRRIWQIKISKFSEALRIFGDLREANSVQIASTPSITLIHRPFLVGSTPSFDGPFLAEQSVTQV
jgi:hypothetical protein